MKNICTYELHNCTSLYTKRKLRVVGLNVSDDPQHPYHEVTEQASGVLEILYDGFHGYTQQIDNVVWR